MSAGAKGDARAAAERLEIGIERYGAGDVAGAARAFEEALQVCPDHGRAAAYLKWTREAQPGASSVAAAVANQPPVPTSTVVADGEGLAWDPPPLTPTTPPKENVALASTMLVSGVTPAAPPAAAPSDEMSFADVMSDEMPTTPVASMPPATGTGTLLGLFVPESLLNKPLPAVIPAVPPAASLDALEMPDLSDSQISELLAIDAAQSAAQPMPAIELQPEAESPRGEDELQFDSPLDDMPSELTKPFIKPEDLPSRPLPVLTPAGGPKPPPPPPPPAPKVSPLKATVLQFGESQRSTNASESDAVFALVRATFDRGEVTNAFDASERAAELLGGPSSDGVQRHREFLEELYVAIVGKPQQILVHGKVSANLDPRSAFLLSRIDGTLSFEDILDISGMPRFDTLRTLAKLIRSGALEPK